MNPREKNPRAPGVNNRELLINKVLYYTPAFCEIQHIFVLNEPLRKDDGYKQRQICFHGIEKIEFHFVKG
jgi:hypothetical protein